MHVDWKSRHGRYSGGPPPSGVHGWLTKLRGIVSFNRRLIRHGNREIEDARAYRHYERERRNRRRRRHSGSGRGVFGSLFGRRRRYEEGEAVVEGGGRRHHRRHQPFMHPRHRCKPWYHGDHHRFFGFLTGRRERMERGLSMRAEAARERRRERRRRQRRLAEEGLAIRMGAEAVGRGTRHRGHREAFVS